LGNYFDTLSWKLVAGNYTAQGGETYLIIGNYKNDTTTNVVFVNSSGIYSHIYVYVDNVSLSICTSVDELYKNDLFSITPNPSNGTFKINYDLTQNHPGTLEILDITGKIIYTQTLPAFSTMQNILLPQISNGIYNCVIRVC